DVYTTDAEIAYYGLRLLEDDLRHFPAYDAVVLYRRGLAAEAPRAVAAIRKLEDRIAAGRMAALNAAVKIEGRPETEVASAFLADAFGIRQQAARETAWTRLWGHTAEHLAL